MTQRIAIVTDSTCDVAPEELAEWGVECINLRISDSQGNPLVSDNEAKSVEAFYEYLDTCDELPKTSMPSPLEFGEMYTRLAKEGYEGVFSLHIAGAMSGTANAARMAAASASIPVKVLDTHRNTWGLAMLVRLAAILRDQGDDLDTIASHVEEMIPLSNIIFTIDKFDNLVKGGRAGKALGLAASLLDIKPILSVDDEGVVETLAKTKSMKRAISRLCKIVGELTQKIGPLEGFIVHARNPQGAEQLRKEILESGVPFKDLGTRQIGPVIANHVGAGCVGFSYIPARS